MNLIYNILPTYFLLDVCISSISNIDFPRGGSYLRYSDPAPAQQRDNNYQNYDSYSSPEVVMREAPRRRRKHRRRIEYSDSEFKCQCSCTKCQKPKPKPKQCCEDFCASECAAPNNILVVPYPVPFIIFNQSTPEYPTTLPTTHCSSTTTTTPETTTTTTTTPESTTTTETPPTRKTIPVSQSTAAPYYDPRPYKRFRIISDNNMRRNNMAKNMLRSPSFGRLPRYGIVPIPENLALSLMQQIKKDQNNDQFRKRLALDRNLLDYTRRGIA